MLNRANLSENRRLVVAVLAEQRRQETTVVVGSTEFEDPIVMPDVGRLALLHGTADAAVTDSVCYFIGGETGAIKIGHSIDVPKRVRQIQRHSPVKLSILAICPGGALRELAYHKQFDHLRLHYEWFERSPEIEEEIAYLNEATEGQF